MVAVPAQGQVPTTVTLVSSSNPSDFGSVITLTATVNPSSALGTVTFYNGVTPIGAAVVSAGAATLTTGLLPPDVSQLTARYNGSSANLPGVSAVFPQIVNSAPQGYYTPNPQSNLPALPAATYAADAVPFGAAVGDFNNDGKQDLAISNNTGNNVSVLLGNGDGTFLPPHDYPVGAGAAAVVTADFNGDGRQDLAVTNNQANSVSILLGNGDGTFQAARNFATGAGPLYLVVADLNSDGKPDLAIENSVSATLTILFGVGDGTFTGAATYLVGQYPSGITTADFNGDHIPDLAVSIQGPGTVMVFYGTANGSLTTGPTLSADVPLTGILAGDLNGDNRPDIIVTGSLSDGLNVGGFLNNGDGTYTAVPGTALGLSSSGGGSFIAADLNGDGNLDLLFAGGTILYGAGNGQFDTSLGPYFPTRIEPAFTLAAGDFTGNGRVDFVGTDQNTGLVDVYLGLPIHPIVQLGSLPQRAPGQPITLQFTLSSDGPNATTPSPTGSVVIYSGLQVIGTAPVTDRAAAFTTKLLAGVPYGLYGVYSGDGNYSAGSFSPATAVVISSTQPGTYVLAAPVSLPSFPTGLSMNDFNGDSNEDLAVINGVPGAAGQVTILLGSGNATFANGQTYPVGINPSAIATADLNLDGHPDIVVANAGSNTISVLLGNADGTFQTAVTYPVGTDPVALTIMDFNEDLKNDILVANQVSGDVSVLLGNGNGTFQAATSIPTGVSPSGLTGSGQSNNYRAVTLAISSLQSGGALLPYSAPGMVGPPLLYSSSTGESATQFFNLGSPGLVAVNPAENTVTLFGINPPFTLTPGPLYPVASGPVALAQLPLNFIAVTPDGPPFAPSPDLAVAASGSNSVSILPLLSNYGGSSVYTSTYGPASNYPVGPQPVALVTGDFNNDGIPDFAVANENGANVTILLGSGTPYPLAITQTPNSAVTGTAFTPALQATTAPLVPVQFLLSTASPTGFFAGGGRSATVISNGSGVATAPTLIAGNTVGVYTVGITAGLSTTAVNLQTTGANCIFVISPYTLALPGGAQTVNLTLTASLPTCAWAAATDSGWLSLSPASGTGSASLTLTVAANTTGNSRSGNLLIAGQTVPVTEDLTTEIFTDVTPTDYFFDAANLISQAGLTNGCAAMEFCPDQEVTRAEMAVFIVRGVIGSDNFTYSPTPVFLDVPVGAPFFPYIQKLSELGITAGCGNGNFCPNDNLPRDQAAVLIIRARYGATATYTYPPIAYFTDVPVGAFGFAQVQRLKVDGITNGCSVTLFCPSETVSRGDAAVFSARGLLNQLLPPGTPTIASANPSQITTGGTQTITLAGTNTNWAQGLTTIAPIPGFTIGTVTITSPTTLTVSLTATPAAPLQPVTLQAITGVEQAILPNRLTVVPSN